ncbi:MAG: hypothetical protein KatS3mg105_4872 [Gemmatales bacterium]|nr:MAG: hypothetical protein KatS3mg105_4872 [Gemmatales bacterium]
MFDPKEVGFYFSLAQIGMEMVAPVVVGVLLDRQFDWTPWGAIAGAVLGFVSAFVHLLALLRQREKDQSRSERMEK